ncbi:Polysaccharide deacetylase [Streptosporangium canum]|uniref:Polysaccharide deacetylase n=2 Tax=Streptosporangium canum TaxID=324952 RepID=A0A1I3IF31_9ACTN|nr:Polysaccharide deacetylase [Streptosporangium canum]
MVRMNNAPMVWVYHSVAEFDRDPLRITVSPDSFHRHMRWLRDRGLRGVTMRELRAAEARGEAAGLVGLTFDDGYADFATTVVPALAEYGFTATVFVVAGHVGGDSSWDPGVPRDVMTPEQLREVVAVGMEIGSHSLTHPRLPTVDGGRRLVEEFTTSKAVLEDLTGEAVSGFCYPYGQHGAREVEAVTEAGFGYACALWHTEHAGLFAMPRIEPFDETGPMGLRGRMLAHRMNKTYPNIRGILKDRFGLDLQARG